MQGSGTSCTRSPDPSAGSGAGGGGSHSPGLQKLGSPPRPHPPPLQVVSGHWFWAPCIIHQIDRLLPFFLQSSHCSSKSLKSVEEYVLLLMKSVKNNLILKGYPQCFSSVIFFFIFFFSPLKKFFLTFYFVLGCGLPRWSNSGKKNLPVNPGDSRDAGLTLHWEGPLEKEMPTRSSILAWRIPWTDEPGGLQSMGLQSVRHN